MSETSTGPEISEWMEGLSPCGLYYEGYTDDLQNLLTKHSSATVTTYGVRGSHINHAAAVTNDDDKENVDNKNVNNEAMETQKPTVIIDTYNNFCTN